MESHLLRFAQKGQLHFDNFFKIFMPYYSMVSSSAERHYRLRLQLPKLLSTRPATSLRLVSASTTYPLVTSTYLASFGFHATVNLCLDPSIPFLFAKRLSNYLYVLLLRLHRGTFSVSATPRDRATHSSLYQPIFFVAHKFISYFFIFADLSLSYSYSSYREYPCFRYPCFLRLCFRPSPRSMMLSCARSRTLTRAT